MAKATLIILGMLILIATFFILEVSFTASDKSNIRTVDSLCTTEVDIFGINLPVGSWGSKALGAQEQCDKARQLTALFTYGWIGYLFGAILLLIGLVTGGARHVYHHHEPEHHKSGAKHCGECGEKLRGHEKHCPECGTKI